jgi:hypothetical protein
LPTGEYRWADSTEWQVGRRSVVAELVAEALGKDLDELDPPQ